MICHVFDLPPLRSRDNRRAVNSMQHCHCVYVSRIGWMKRPQIYRTREKNWGDKNKQIYFYTAVAPLCLTHLSSSMYFVFFCVYFFFWLSRIYFTVDLFGSVFVRSLRLFVYLVFVACKKWEVKKPNSNNNTYNPFLVWYFFGLCRNYATVLLGARAHHNNSHEW